MAARNPTGVLDTSTVIALSELTDAKLLPEEPLITAMTLAELAVGPQVATDADERARRQARLQQAEADFVPLPFDVQTAHAFGLVSAALRRRGRKPAARGLDAMVAATAIANGLPLYTCNPDDFAGTDGLEVVAVPFRDEPSMRGSAHAQGRSARA